MHIETRKMLDRAFSSVGFIAIFLMSMALLCILVPVIWRGSGAFVFKSTVEYRRLMLDVWNRGNISDVEKQIQETDKFRRPIYEMIDSFKKELRKYPREKRREYKQEVKDLKEKLAELLGPFPGSKTPVLMRKRYGQTRWGLAKKNLHEILYKEEWDYSDPTKMGVKKFVPRVDSFKGTSLEKLFPYLKDDFKQMMQPRWTFYYQFLFDCSKDAHFFGGIWPELLGTIYLTIGAMLFAVPTAIIAAIYLCEYAGGGKIISVIRICISTLAGVPSIVFGLFGLAFFLETIKISDSKSILAGSLTLGLLILPTIIRATEEAILAVPITYKEAALSLGAGRWHTIVTVVLPAALPGILTGIVISMGRAAGETAPIIFTAAVSVGKPVKIWNVLSSPTPALPWNIYNLCTEHEAVDAIRHVQFGMVLTLISVVLFLNLTAIIIRARIARKIKN